MALGILTQGSCQVLGNNHGHDRVSVEGVEPGDVPVSVLANFKVRTGKREKRMLPTQNLRLSQSPAAPPWGHFATHSQPQEERR